VAVHDLEEHFNKIINLINVKIINTELQKKLLLMCSGMKDEMLKWPASVRHHHAFRGGYVVHVSEVMTNIMNIMSLFNWIDTTVDESLSIAFVHDVDKLKRYEVDSEEPSPAQLNYAQRLGIKPSPGETKSSISKKIDAKKSGLDPDMVQIEDCFAYRDRFGVNPVGEVVAICAAYNIEFTEKMLNAVTYHHGGWSDDIVARPHLDHNISNLGILLHMADLASTYFSRIV
jgi:hypothetical protein